MGTITITVDNETERLFRETVKREKGEGKGKLGSAISDALRRWAEEKRQTEIAAELSALMKKGFNMGKLKVHVREELYDRS